MTPRSPPRILTGHCDRYLVTTASPVAHPAMSGSSTRCILRRYSTGAPRKQGLRLGTWVSAGPASFARPRSPSADEAASEAHPADHRVPEEHRDLRRSDPELCGLRRGIHPLCGRPGVLRRQGIFQRPEALHELSCQPASRPRRWVRRPRHRWPARLRARGRPPRSRVLRGRVLLVRQPGAGPLQASHGPPGVLLGLLPDGSPGLTVRPRSTWPPALTA